MKRHKHAICDGLHFLCCVLDAVNRNEFSTDQSG
jgi:hypothetical protein